MGWRPRRRLLVAPVRTGDRERGHLAHGAQAGQERPWTRRSPAPAALTRVVDPPEPEYSPRPEWSPLPRAGCAGVEGRVLMVRDGLAVAMLRFEPRATIDEHSAQHDIDVACL